MMNVDLTNCDREPIHIPGRTQSHGFLIATNGRGIITHCSENIVEFTGVKAQSILGQHNRILDPLIGQRENDGFLSQIIALASNGGDFLPSNPYATRISHFPWDISISQSGNHYLFDFEPERSDLADNLQAQIGRALSEMLADKELSRILKGISINIRKIIGYDRVMIYKFHEDDHGEVVAEAKKAELGSWLGLHYPASDIPKQARQLYLVNLVRLIADVHTPPINLLSREETPLDLTASSLRAVSPIHIQYLKNMGVASSFSVSIVDNDRLWGLIACHNYTPRFINFRQRESARLVGQVLSSAISFRQAEEDQQMARKFEVHIGELTHYLSRDIDIPEALIGQSTTLLNITQAEGAALFFEGRIYLTGSTPEPGFVQEIIQWLSARPEDIFHSDSLLSYFPDANPHKAVVSGLLSCRISRESNEFLLWFKPEFISTVAWAGNPEKPVEVSNGLATISPRQSFAAWNQLVSEHSRPWLKAEIQSVRALRDEIIHAINRKATALRHLNSKLREAYAELDAFSYTLSHDLKNPVSAIRGFAQLISAMAPENDSVRSMADRINLRASGLTQMIDDVLRYSRLGQSTVDRQTVNMQELLLGIRNDLLAAAGHQKLEILVLDTPDIEGDQTMLYQVFSNLMGNAVKYSSKRDAPVVSVKGESIPGGVLYSISDNGIGIDSQYHEKIFELFSRAETEETFEGSGVGLAIVKRLLTKHLGKIWLVSEPGLGTTFYVQFTQ